MWNRVVSIFDSPENDSVQIERVLDDSCGWYSTPENVLLGWQVIPCPATVDCVKETEKELMYNLTFNLLKHEQVDKYLGH